TATLLPNGKVLVAAGYNGLSSAELYDPASGTWTVTGSLNGRRFNHTASLLPNGTVLVAGGQNGGPLASTQLYDPASGTWAATGSLNTGRYRHTSTLLPNNKLIITGGSANFGVSASAELYDTGLGFLRTDWQPQIATITVMSGGRLALT